MYICNSEQLNAHSSWYSLKHVAMDFEFTVETDGKEASDKVIKLLHSLLFKEYSVSEVLYSGDRIYIPTKKTCPFICLLFS